MASFVSSKYSSLTQTFRLSVPDGVPGVFVSRLRLYFKKKSESLGVQIYLLRQKNGLPDPEQVVAGSLVTLESENVNVSADGSSETDFIFSQLIYLSKDESYAFVVKPIGNSPDYEIWVGELGKRDIANDKPIGSNPLVESAYYSGNSDRWADLVNQDVKFSLFRAKFKTSTTGIASLRNKNAEILKMYNVSSILGKKEIRAGDEVFGWANNYVNTAISATISRYDEENRLLYLKNSSGNFTANTDVVLMRTGTENDPLDNESGIIALARIESTTANGVYGFPVHSIVPKLGVKKTPFTDISLSYKGAIWNGTKYVQGDEINIQNNYETELLDTSRYLLGRSAESSGVNDLKTGTPSKEASVVISASLQSNNDFISPAIDLHENNVLLLRNLINSNTTNEHTNNGGAAARYISKVITLEDGMEAEDLKIYINANKPANTGLKVYTKIWCASDTEPFDKKVWSLMVQENSDTITNATQPDQYLEYVYSFANTTTLAGNAFAAFQTDGQTSVQYSSANSTGGTSGGPIYGGANTTVSGEPFKKFAVKLVLTSDSGVEHLYPKVNDLRVIALQV